jgi:hypothetical protein
MVKSKVATSEDDVQKEPPSAPEKSKKSQRELKNTYTLQNIRDSKKIRKTSSIPQVIEDLLKKMHENTGTLKAFEFTDSIIELVVEEAKRKGMLIENDTLSEEQKLHKIRGEIDSTVQGLYKVLGDYKTIVYDDMRTLEQLVRRSPADFVPNGYSNLEKARATAI